MPDECADKGIRREVAQLDDTRRPDQEGIGSFSRKGMERFAKEQPQQVLP
jgi:hypothetical protein